MDPMEYLTLPGSGHEAAAVLLPGFKPGNKTAAPSWPDPPDIKITNKVWPEQNVCPFTDDTINGIFFREKFCVLIQMTLKFLPKCSTYNKLGIVSS